MLEGYEIGEKITIRKKTLRCCESGASFIFVTAVYYFVAYKNLAYWCLCTFTILRTKEASHVTI